MLQDLYCTDVIRNPAWCALWLTRLGRSSLELKSCGVCFLWCPFPPEANFLKVLLNFSLLETYFPTVFINSGLFTTNAMYRLQFLSNFVLLQTSKTAPDRYRKLKHFHVYMQSWGKPSLGKASVLKCTYSFKILLMRETKLFSPVCFPGLGCWLVLCLCNFGSLRLLHGEVMLYLISSSTAENVLKVPK